MTVRSGILWHLGQ